MWYVWFVCLWKCAILCYRNTQKQKAYKKKYNTKHRVEWFFFFAKMKYPQINDLFVLNLRRFHFLFFFQLYVVCCTMLLYVFHCNIFFCVWFWMNNKINWRNYNQYTINYLTPFCNIGHNPSGYINSYFYTFFKCKKEGD